MLAAQWLPMSVTVIGPALDTELTTRGLCEPENESAVRHGPSTGGQAAISSHVIHR